MSYILRVVAVFLSAAIESFAPAPDVGEEGEQLVAASPYVDPRG